MATSPAEVSGRHLYSALLPDDAGVKIVTDEPAVPRVTLRPVVVDPRLVLIARTP